MPKLEVIQDNAALLTLTYAAGENDATKIRVQTGPQIQDEMQLSKLLLVVVIHLVNSCESDHMRLDLATGEISGPPDAQA